MVFLVPGPWLIAMSVALCAIGLFLLFFYGTWLFFVSRRAVRNDEEHPFALLGGWAGGCFLLATGVLLLLPVRFSWLAIPLGIVMILGFFPLARRFGSGTGGGMKSFVAVVEYHIESEMFVGYVPGFPGAYSQDGDLDDLRVSLQAVIAKLLEDGEPSLKVEFVGVERIEVPTKWSLDEL